MREAPSLSERLTKLAVAIATRRSNASCLRLWSAFVRARDGHRCVDCHSDRYIAAHHICRKTLMPDAQFQTGNGITLCRDCHRGAHLGFNGRPDLSVPMDAQGGEKIETMQRLYGALMEDARDRGILRDDYYFLSDAVLARFKMLQGFEPTTAFPGRRVEQAFLIWWQSPRPVAEEIAAANGFNVSSRPRMPGSIFIFFDK